MTETTIGRVVSVNVGQPRQVRWLGRLVSTAIWKSPVAGRQHVAGVNIEGDDQADRRVHGGPTKAIYAYAAADYMWWTEELDQALEPGTFGDNLTLEAIDPAACVVGERWRIGTVLLRVTEPRIPCFKLGMRMGDAAFIDLFAQAARPGTYLAIEADGDIGAADAIELVSRPDHGVTIGNVERAYHGHTELLPLLPELEDLSESWREWAARAIARNR